MKRMWFVSGMADNQSISDTVSGELCEAIFKIRNIYKPLHNRVNLVIESEDKTGQRHYWGEYNLNKKKELESGEVLINNKLEKII